MSWDAELYTEVDGKRVQCGDDDWNYTHNTNCMIAAVLEDAGKEVGSAWWNDLRKEKGDYWCTALNGLTGAEGAKLLTLIIDGLAANPSRFIAMNPSNGWGSYQRLLPILRQMRDASQDWPSAKWSIS